MKNNNYQDNECCKNIEELQRIRSKYSCAIAILSALFFLLLGILLVLLLYC